MCKPDTLLQHLELHEVYVQYGAVVAYRKGVGSEEGKERKIHHQVHCWYRGEEVCTCVRVHANNDFSFFFSLEKATDVVMQLLFLHS